MKANLLKAYSQNNALDFTNLYMKDNEFDNSLLGVKNEC